jgi:hypothetical protein
VGAVFESSLFSLDALSEPSPHPGPPPENQGRELKGKAQWRILPLKRAAQGSNLPLLDLESSVPPLELATRLHAQGGIRTPVGS